VVVGEVDVESDMEGVKEGVPLTLIRLTLLEEGVKVGVGVGVGVGDGEGDLARLAGDPEGSSITAEGVGEEINNDILEAMGDNEVELVVERDKLPEHELEGAEEGVPWVEEEARAANKNPPLKFVTDGLGDTLKVLGKKGSRDPDSPCEGEVVTTWDGEKEPKILALLKEEGDGEVEEVKVEDTAHLVT